MCGCYPFSKASLPRRPIVCQGTDLFRTSDIPPPVLISFPFQRPWNFPLLNALSACHPRRPGHSTTPKTGHPPAGPRHAVAIKLLLWYFRVTSSGSPGRPCTLTAHCSLRTLTPTFLTAYLESRGGGLGQIATPPTMFPSCSPSSVCLPLPCKCKTLVTGFPSESGAAAALGCLEKRTLLPTPPNSLLAMRLGSSMAGLVSSRTLSSLTFCLFLCVSGASFSLDRQVHCNF